MPEFLQQKKMPESIFFKAENGTRTHDPFITSEVLYQLSYFSGLGYYICSWEFLQL